MLMIAMANLVVTVVIIGLVGFYIFPIVAGCTALNYGILKLFFSGKEVAANDSEAQTNQDSEEARHNFLFSAGLSSAWLPAVVADERQKIFLVCGITNLAAKTIVLVVAVSLSASGLQPYMYARPFILACVEDSSPLLNQADITPCSFSNETLGVCFGDRALTHEDKYTDELSKLQGALQHFIEAVARIDKQVPNNRTIFQDKLRGTTAYATEVNEVQKEFIQARSGARRVIQQKIRICDSDERPLRLSLLAGILVLLVLAAIATYRLQKIADYKVILNLAFLWTFPYEDVCTITPQILFYASTTILGCFPAPNFCRVIHRSLIFEALKTRDKVLLLDILRALWGNKSQKEESSAKAVESAKYAPSSNKQDSHEDESSVAVIMKSLEEMEHLHNKINKDLLSANQVVKNSEVKKLLQFPEKLQSIRDTIKTNEEEKINLLDRPNSDGESPLHVSCTIEDNVETTKELVCYGANVNIENSAGNSPLFLACERKDIKTVTLLLQNQAKFKINRELKTPAITDLFEHDSKPNIEYLVKAIKDSVERRKILDRLVKEDFLLSIRVFLREIEGISFTKYLYTSSKKLHKYSY